MISNNTSYTHVPVINCSRLPGLQILVFQNIDQCDMWLAADLVSLSDFTVLFWVFQWFVIFEILHWPHNSNTAGNMKRKIQGRNDSYLDDIIIYSYYVNIMTIVYVVF